MKEISIKDADSGQRLDKFLRRYLPEAGSGFLYKMLRKKNIVLNGKKAEGTEILQIGDTVSLYFAEETLEKFRGQEVKKKRDVNAHLAYEKISGVSIVYEDENLLLCNKPAGLLTQKAKPTDLSLNDWLLGYLSEQIKEDSNGFVPSVLNRLDRNTSGLVLCSKSLKGAQVFSRLLQTRELKKFYVAVVDGKLEKAIHLEGYLKKDSVQNQVRIFSTPFSGCEEIITDIKPLHYQNGLTLVEIHLVTGKPHQIRAHLQSIGHPIVGDPKYGNIGVNKRYPYIRRQLLHAYRLEIPVLQETALKKCSQKIFEIPYPKDFMELTVCQHGNRED